MPDEFDDDDDIELWDEADLATLEATAQQQAKQPTFTQHTLFGKPVQPVAGPSRKPAAAPPPVEPKQPEVLVNKEWDRGLFKRVGWGVGAEKPGKKAKGKARALEPDDEFYDSYALEDEEIDHSRLYDDPELNPDRPPPPMELVYDPEQAKTFVYPLNKPRRDYQYNIVRRALFTNVLCALPTGLGKTFIAAVVMLNFYRWYPKGKIIFMAPTRPLVNQQIEACHAIAGIPASDAALITGQDQPANRAMAWEKRRVFYATPQTVVNDLKTAKLNPKDVICVVIDEAHKASGDYAYCGVVRYLMTKNPHFRVLALTATPGSKSEAVQNVVDNLHIGHIEIRCEESLDLRQYIHKKEVVEQVVPISGDCASLRDGILEIMKPLAKRCYDAGLIRMFDPMRLKPFAIQMAMRESKQVKWAYPVLEKLRKLASSIGYLLEHSITSCTEDLAKCIGKKNSQEDQALQRLITQAKTCKMVPGYVPHPKMDALRSLLIDHFSQENSKDTRIMVFCHYRGVVEEIVECLNEQKPLIRASRFVGQGTDKAGGKGFGQKQQQETIKRFKEGDFNTLVATSIGEEGLDIGEVDLIVCYDTNKSPIRMLQRVGRTGRARQGKIVVLLTEGRDEQNWKSAQDNYAVVQHAILSGKALELYADCERLLPKSVQPTPDLRPVDVEPFDHNALSLGAGSKRKATGDPGVKGTKRKRDYVPEGANLGFSAASDLMAERKSKVVAAEPEEGIEEREAAACLTEGQMDYLDTRWRGPAAKLYDKPDESRLPIGPSVQSRIGRSDRHARLRRVAEHGADVAASTDSLLSWKNPTYNAFDPALVSWWEEAKAGTGARPFVSCRRLSRQLEEPDEKPSRSLAPPKPAVGTSQARSQSTTPTLKDEPLNAEPTFAMYGLPDSDDDELPDASEVLSDPPRLVSSRLKKASTPVIDLDDSENEHDDPLGLFDDDAMVVDGRDLSLRPKAAPIDLDTPSKKDAPLLFAVGGLESSSPAQARSPQVSKDQPARSQASLHETIAVPSSQPGSKELSSPTQELSSPVREQSSPVQELSSPMRVELSPTRIVSRDRTRSPGKPLERKVSNESFEGLEDDFDNDVFAELDRVEAKMKSDADKMPPPPLPTSTTGKPGSAAQLSKESPAMRRLTADLQDDSSPAVVIPGRRVPAGRRVEDSDDSGRPALARRPGDGPRLIRGGEKRALEAGSPKQKREGQPHKPHKRVKVALHQNGLFDVEAVNDDDSQEESSEGYESENDSDRAFVDQTMTSDGGSTDMNMYRISVSTQAPDYGFDPARKPGAFRMRFVGGFDPSKVDPDDTYERDSFCASDDEALDFDTSSQTQEL